MARQGSFGLVFLANHVEDSEFEGTEGVAGFRQAREVGVVAECEGPFMPQHSHVDGGGIAVTGQQSATEGKVVARCLVDIPAHVAPIDQFAIETLMLVAGHRHQAPLFPVAPFRTGIQVPPRQQVRIGGLQVADVRLVDVAHGETCLGVESFCPLAEPGHSGTKGGIDDLRAAEALRGVGQFHVFRAEAHLSYTPFEGNGKEIVAVAYGLEPRHDGVGRGGAVAQRAGTVVGNPQAPVQSVAVTLAAHQAQLRSGGEGLEGGAHRGPLVAIDGAETAGAVEEAGVGGVEEQRVEVEHGEMDVLRFRAIES